MKILSLILKSDTIHFKWDFPVLKSLVGLGPAWLRDGAPFGSVGRRDCVMMLQMLARIVAWQYRSLVSSCDNGNPSQRWHKSWPTPRQQREESAGGWTYVGWHMWNPCMTHVIHTYTRTDARSPSPAVVERIPPPRLRPARYDVPVSPFSSCLPRDSTQYDSDV